MQMAIEQARQANPAIKIGVCGEHGGDPESIEFLETLGLDYISCSPARIPAARLAIAQTAIAREAHSPALDYRGTS
jgi:pyruvate,orthophosphate dikinase